MAEVVLKVIPIDPGYIPPVEAQREAVSVLAPSGEYCFSQTHERISIVDIGLNLEAIDCPACSERLYIDFDSNPDDIYDAPSRKGRLWWDICERLKEESVSTMMLCMPCCEASVPLGSLTFFWPAPFASFELSIVNPKMSDRMPVETLRQLETILKCNLQVVRALFKRGTLTAHSSGHRFAARANPSAGE